MDPKAPGTVIGPASSGRSSVTSIASKRGIHLVNIVSGRMLGQSGFMSKVFDAFRMHDVVVDLIATSEVSVTVSVDDEENLPAVVQDLKAFSTVTVRDGAALVAVIGERMTSARGLAGIVFAAIADIGAPVNAISYGATKTNLQIVVPEAKEHDVVRALHAALFTD
jgi:aspartate kinase